MNTKSEKLLCTAWITLGTAFFNMVTGSRSLRAEKCVLPSSGFQGDIKALHKNLAARELKEWRCIQRFSLRIISR
ncbi:unnamed protein product, partial [Urochloa humidicola]